MSLDSRVHAQKMPPEMPPQGANMNSRVHAQKMPPEMPPQGANMKVFDGFASPR